MRVIRQGHGKTMFNCQLLMNLFYPIFLMIFLQLFPRRITGVCSPIPNRVQLVILQV